MTVVTTGHSLTGLICPLAFLAQSRTFLLWGRTSASRAWHLVRIPVYLLHIQHNSSPWSTPPDACILIRRRFPSSDLTAVKPRPPVREVFLEDAVSDANPTGAPVQCLRSRVAAGWMAMFHLQQRSRKLALPIRDLCHSLGIHISSHI